MNFTQSTDQQEAVILFSPTEDNSGRLAFNIRMIPNIVPTHGIVLTNRRNVKYDWCIFHITDVGVGIIRILSEKSKGRCGTCELRFSERRGRKIGHFGIGLDRSGSWSLV